MDEENKSIKEGAARFWPTTDKLVVGTADSDYRKKLEILSDIHVCSVDTECSSEWRANVNDLFEMVGSFCALDGADKPKTGLPMKHGPMEGGGAE